MFERQHLVGLLGEKRSEAVVSIYYREIVSICQVFMSNCILITAESNSCIPSRKPVYHTPLLKNFCLLHLFEKSILSLNQIYNGKYSQKHIRIQEQNQENYIKNIKKKQLQENQKKNKTNENNEKINKDKINKTKRE